MSWKRNGAELVLGIAGRLVVKRAFSPRAEPNSVFILRNNDIGDLLIITPLFEALRHLLPQAQLVIGVGDWNVEVLRHNPYISETMSVNAPWHNKRVVKQGKWQALKYIFSSTESRLIAMKRFDVGIDVLGSPFGSLLMMRCAIPFRMGVKGYAGGHAAVQRYVQFNQDEHVGRSALRFAELLGTHQLPENRPQIFLTEDERERGDATWASSGERKRIIIAPGGGFPEKCWPVENYVELARRLAVKDYSVNLIGGAGEQRVGELMAQGGPRLQNLCGRLTLRESFASIASANVVVANSSMAMHVAAAFRKRAVILLGDTLADPFQHQSQWGYPEQSVRGQKLPDPNDWQPEGVVREIERLVDRCVEEDQNYAHSNTLLS